MLIWKAKAAKSTGALKSVSVHQFDNTFTMKTSNCKAFSIDTCLQLRLSRSAEIPSIFILTRGWENFNSSILFLKPRQCLRQRLPHKSLYHIRLWQTRCYLMTPLFTVFFLHCCRLTQQIPHSAFSSRLSLCCSLCGEICSAALTCSPCESIKRRKSSCSL